MSLRWLSAIFELFLMGLRGTGNEQKFKENEGKLIFELKKKFCAVHSHKYAI